MFQFNRNQRIKKLEKINSILKNAYELRRSSQDLRNLIGMMDDIGSHDFELRLMDSVSDNVSAVLNNPELTSAEIYEVEKSLLKTSLEFDLAKKQIHEQIAALTTTGKVMAHTFTLNSEALKREFSVYVVIASNDTEISLYVGKTGDNREGCNPIISRCGNHFSYNKIHSQVRNKISDHENKKYTYVFDHFGEYTEDEVQRKVLVDQINEMERYLNQEINKLSEEFGNCILHNPYSGKYGVKSSEREKRAAFRTAENSNKINSIVNSVKAIVVN